MPAAGSRRRDTIDLVRTHPRVLAVLALAAAACASTKLVSVYADESFAGPAFEKLLVVGLGATEGGRAAFESAVVARLEAQGVVGAASHDVIVEMEDASRARVRRLARQEGYDAVLVTRLLDVRKETRYEPPVYGDFYGYWGHYGGYVADPGYVIETTTLVMETSLFDTVTGKVVYSAESETFQPRSRNTVIEELVPLVVDDLTQRGILAARR
jgi:hypothetical protein